MPGPIQPAESDAIHKRLLHGNTGSCIHVDRSTPRIPLAALRPVQERPVSLDTPTEAGLGSSCDVMRDASEKGEILKQMSHSVHPTGCA